MEMKKVGAPALEKHVVDRLLDLLSTDDQFRALFVADVNAALELAGYVSPHGADETFAGPGGCLRVTSLASKEKIQRERGRLAEVLGVPFGFFAPSDLRAD